MQEFNRDEYRKSVGDNIYWLRDKANMTQMELSELLNISISFLGLIERGQRAPSMAVLMKCSEIFNVTIDDLTQSKSSYCPKKNNGDDEIINEIQSTLQLLDGYECEIILGIMKVICNARKNNAVCSEAK